MAYQPMIDQVERDENGRPIFAKPLDISSYWMDPKIMNPDLLNAAYYDADAAAGRDTKNSQMGYAADERPEYDENGNILPAHIAREIRRRRQQGLLSALQTSVR